MNAVLKRLSLCTAVVVLAACSGPTITGKVINNADGAPIASALVSSNGASATTGADGVYTLPASAGARQVVSVTRTGFVAGSRVVRVAAGQATPLDFKLLPVAVSVTFDPTAAKTVATDAGTASVALGAGVLRTATGGTPGGNAIGNLTPIDPSSDPQLMPGNFETADGGNIQSFGALALDFTDPSGAPLNLVTGQTATIRIPVALAALSGAPSTMPAFRYDPVTGTWVQEGTLTLAGSGNDRYYTGSVSQLATWNADQVMNTGCIAGKVVNAAGVPVVDARIEAQGRSYLGTSTAYSAADGTFTIKVKADASVIVTAVTADALSQSVVATGGSAGGTCDDLSEDLKLGAAFGSAGSGSAKVKLTWGLDPYDLDSHLTGPDGNGGRFHVYYSSKGDLVTAPFAALDVDDTTSFGPEVVTISKLLPGSYTYSVMHYAGSGTIITSPARIELTINGQTTVYTPPATADTIGDNYVWKVFQIEVAGNGAATVSTLGTYYYVSSSSDVTKPVGPGGTEWWGPLPRK